ncbi:MAG: hypothetical protein R3B69_02515 [Candidatus Paceibacterota bacterium]
MTQSLYLYIAPDLTSAPLPTPVQTAGLDVVHIATGQFTIDDARRLKVASHTKSVASTEHAFIIAARTLTTEAQNALLKLFEEPPAGSAFYVVVPHESVLIPTLRSRFTTVERTVKEDTPVEFLELTYQDRLALIAEKAKAKDQVWMDRVLTTVATKHASLDAPALQSLALVERYLNNRGASRKMLLEELALALPVGQVKT